MKVLITAWIFITGLTACNNTGETTTTKTDSNSLHVDTSDVSNEIIPPAKPESINGCYMRVLERDTLVAHLQELGGQITGKLTFDNYQKDGSTGGVTGRRNGNVLELIYSFDSEGMHSIMEVYFKKEGSTLIRGIGDMAMRGDTMAYTHPQQLKFPAAEKWNVVSCESLDAKYR